MKNCSPFIIYDSRADAQLKKMGMKFGVRNYKQYCEAWKKQYELHRPQILSAVRGLHNIKVVILDWNESEEKTKKLVHSEWFLERVFDIYLYQNAD